MKICFSSKMKNFNPIAKALLIFLIIISLCEGNVLRKKNNYQSNQDNLNEILTDDDYSKALKDSKFNQENMSNPSSFFKVPFEFFYFDNLRPSSLTGSERNRKFDPSDRSFIRFGRSFDNYQKTMKQPEKNLYKKYTSYMLRPSYEARDTSFLRFGRKLN